MQITRQTKVTGIAMLAVLAITVICKLIFEVSWERAFLLAPVFVISVGVIAGMIIFWVRIAIAQWRGEDRQADAPGDQ